MPEVPDLRLERVSWTNGGKCSPFPKGLGRLLAIVGLPATNRKSRFPLTALSPCESCSLRPERMVQFANEVAGRERFG